MTWHVVRLTPNALKPDNGNKLRTIVEKSLTEGGFSYFMPFENKPIIHHRTKKKIWRRFPLMPGYGFVENVTNFEALRKCDGVYDVLKSGGSPVRIPGSEVERVMTDELAINMEHDRKRAMQEARERLGTRAILSQAFTVNSVHDIAPSHKLLSGETITVTGTGAKGRIRGLIARLGDYPVEIDAVHLEAAE